MQQAKLDERVEWHFVRLGAAVALALALVVVVVVVPGSSSFAYGLWPKPVLTSRSHSSGPPLTALWRTKTLSPVRAAILARSLLPSLSLTRFAYDKYTAAVRPLLGCLAAWLRRLVYCHCSPEAWTHCCCCLCSATVPARAPVPWPRLFHRSPPTSLWLATASALQCVV